LKLLTENNCEIIKIAGETKGAVCSSLMAIQHINNDEPLIIANADQIIDTDFDDVITQFERRDVDAGVICFESVHPKWSYVRLDKHGKIIETAEKRPISKNAIAGFYYFNKGKDFVKAGMLLVEKDANVGGLYFVAPTYNELVLDNKNLEIIRITDKQYHSFYSPQKIKEYEEWLKTQKKD
jgi:dTDP-glucose pyrophosphorylase